MTVDALRADDVEEARELSAVQGWNQTREDWRRLVELDPAGCFAARDEGRLIGTVTTTTYGDALAWVGMMVVRSAFRRRGVGAALLRQALDHLERVGVERTMLDATPAGEPLYRSLGFVAEAGVERWTGVPRPVGSSDTMVSTGGSLSDLAALDSAAIGADRTRLLTQLMNDGATEPLVARSSRGKPEGFALARPGRNAIYVGPVVALSEGAAQQLIGAMVERLAPESVCLDLHSAGCLDRQSLQAFGLSPQRGLTRMRLGSRPAAQVGRSLVASAGPELG